ncbi:hypothetical protein C8T65DRAFT_701696 [Cerioporus squamosus]|nr:hypothetical protein C8T65DRAFT_701696 [Cerioporus squamosus]
MFSNALNPTQNVAQMYPPGLRTPNGSLILVPATPSPIPQNAEAAPTATTGPGDANELATPLVAHDTFDTVDSPSPTPALVAPPPMRPPCADQLELTADGDPEVKGGKDSGRAGGLPQVLLSTEGPVCKLTFTTAPSVLSICKATPVAGDAVSLPPSSVETTPSHSATTQARSAELSSSPLSLDWTGEGAESPSPLESASPSPTIRAAHARSQTTANRLGLNLHGGRVENKRVDLTNNDQRTAIPPANGPNVLSGDRAAQEDDVTDYFAFFSSPPTLVDPPHYRNHTLQGAPRDENPLPIHTDYRFGHAEERATPNQPALDDPVAIYRGEHPYPPSSIDQTRTARKRLWQGSPNPEDVQRGQRRARRPSSTPTWRNGGGPTADVCDASNPWTSFREGQTGSLRGHSDVPTFIPVMASTPAHLVRSPGTTSLAARAQLSGNAHTMHSHSETRNDSSILRPAPTRPSRNSTDNHPQIGHQGSYAQPMTIDARDHKPADNHDQPRRDKGKGRARAVSVSTEDEQGPELLPNTEQGAWSEAELLEARQMSLRQAMEDRQRTGGALSSCFLDQTNGAGPSGTGRVHDAYERHQDGQDGSRRDEYTSRTPMYQNDEPSYRSRPHPGPSEATQTRQYDYTPRRNARPRAGTSEFVPLPNTRAARYLADDAAGKGWNAPTFSPQRSPMSGIINTHQTLPRPTRLSRSSRSVRADDRRGGDESKENHDEPASEPRRNRRNRDSTHDEEQHYNDNHDLRARSFARDDLRAHDRSYDRDEGEWNHEDSEALPSALRADHAINNIEPMDVPEGGFPTIYRDDPETSVRGVATEWMWEMWSDPPNSVVLLEIFNYRYTEDDTYNRRILDCLRRAFEWIAEETTFDIVPPEPEDST